MEAATLVGSRAALRHFLAAFCAIIALAWAASLVFVGVSLVLASVRLGNVGPAAAALAVLAIEIGAALVARSLIRKSTDPIASGWTALSVVLALCLMIVNGYLGVGVG
jgi:hypothetical protein